MVLLRAALAALCILLSTSTAFAQQKDIESKVSAYYGALAKSDWDAMATLFSSPAQKQFRSLISEVLAASPGPSGAQLRTVFFGEQLADDAVAKLTDAQFMSKVLGRLFGQAYAQTKIEGAQVVGVVQERPDLAHAVCRVKQSGANQPTMERMTVVTAERTGDTWGLALLGDIKGSLSALRARVPAPAK